MTLSSHTRSQFHDLLEVLYDLRKFRPISPTLDHPLLLWCFATSHDTDVTHMITLLYTLLGICHLY